MRTFRTQVAVLAVGLTVTASLAACGQSGDTASASDEGADYGQLQPGVLKIGTLSDAKPYAYNEDGELKGFEVEMATAIAEHMGLEPQFVQQEFSTLLPAVASGQLDVAAASTSVTEERLKNVDFSDTYFIGYISILVPAGSEITEDIASLEGKRIGLMQGTIQDQYAQAEFPPVEIVRYPDNNAALAAMNAGSIDGVFIDTPIGQAFIDEDDSLSMPINIPLPEYPVAMSVGKEKAELKEAINTAIAEIVASGEWLEINNAYYPGQPIEDMFLPDDSAAEASPSPTN